MSLHKKKYLKKKQNKTKKALFFQSFSNCQIVHLHTIIIHHFTISEQFYSPIFISGQLLRTKDQQTFEQWLYTLKKNKIPFFFF